MEKVEVDLEHLIAAADSQMPDNDLEEHEYAVMDEEDAAEYGVISTADQDIYEQEPGAGACSHDSEISQLKRKVSHLEQEVEALRGELRLMKRKMRSYDPNGDNYQEALEKTILRILDGQNWRICRTAKEVAGKSTSIGTNTKWTRSDEPFSVRSSTRVNRGKRRDGESSGSDIDADDTPEVGVDDEEEDPSYKSVRNNRDLENLRSRILRPGTARRGRGRGRPPLSQNMRRVIVVKKLEPNSPPRDDDNDALNLDDRIREQLPGLRKDKVISAGDVSVILEDEDDDRLQVKRRRRIIKKSDFLLRPKIMQCSHCPKKFRDLHDVKRHERTHTGEKPFFCQTCGPNMRFTQTYHLQRHTNKYHSQD